MKYAAAALESDLLDVAVAKAEGLAPIPRQPRGFFYWKDEHGAPCSGWWAPSAMWEQGGPIIERERIELVPQRMLLAADGKGFRMASDSQSFYQAWLPFADETGAAAQYGETPLIAAMRAFVAAKLGTEVELP